MNFPFFLYSFQTETKTKTKTKCQETTQNEKKIFFLFV